MTIQIITLSSDAHSSIQQTATLLIEGFQDHWPDAWPDLSAAIPEVHESFGSDRISRVAIESDVSDADIPQIVGWIGGIRQYDGHVWELHPLVVKRSHQGQGIGRALVHDLENQVRQRGGLTLWVGTDDETGMTSLSGVDLYDDPLDHLARIQNLRGHPYSFYQRLGFAIVGVMPDANGRGKPDIFMAKRV